MKLRNKKTGEIRNCQIMADGLFVIQSLTELNEEWEDYEEPKEYWYIDWIPEIGVYHTTDCDCEDDKSLKQIGNYFETKEEGEKALEKLKAWKRLKDKGFRFYGYDSSKINYVVNDEYLARGVDMEFLQDFALLFGGEE